ncbi:MAG: protein translocase subunit SecD [Acidobacteria bacterium]|nr:MAG: protein translocase subunit SecD [Acidobacteriota bacterium]
MKPVYLRLGLILVVLVVSIVMIWPRHEGEWINLNLGLDLKGGSHLVLEVVTDDAVKAECNVWATRIAEELRDQGYPDARGEVDQPGRFRISGIPADRLGEAVALAKDRLSGWTVTTEGTDLVARMPDSQIESIRDQAVEQALQTIRNRVDQFGVAEPLIQRVGGRGSNRILLQLPGVEDPSRVKNLIQTQAQLEYRMAYYAPDGTGPFQGLTPEDVVAQLGGTLPPGVEVLPVYHRNNVTGEKEIASYMAVEKASIITGSDLTDARPSRDSYGRPAVSFQLDVEVASRFARHTRENVGRIMPIVLDGKIESAPRIETEIGASGQITGEFTPEQAQDLSLVLRAGALPARVVTIEERTVGPSLGLDSIRQGLRAIVIGFVAVMIFMVVYYKLAGVNAVIALLMNLLIIAAVMAFFGATLTLPGIGGFILTVGMAVDANVLVFERIREELRAGKTTRGALEGGFGKAMSAIVDANITTLIAAVLLFNYGTGPVRGFAVTLSIGILASLFTAIFVSRTLFELRLGNRPGARLYI